MLKNWLKQSSPRLLGGLIWTLAWLVGRTLRLKVRNEDTLQAHLKTGKGAILLTWHGRTLIPANLFYKRGYWALISMSRDGEIQNRIFQRFGFQTIRGSTSRGGVRAALEAARKVRQGGVLAFTPDGPRGPNRKMQPGALLIAQKSGCPVFAVGSSASPRKLLPTWDQYLIPMPFARARLIFGEPIWIPPDADEATLEAFTRQIEAEIDRLEAQAEGEVGGR